MLQISACGVPRCHLLKKEACQGELLMDGCGLLLLTVSGPACALLLAFFIHFNPSTSSRDFLLRVEHPCF